MPSSHGKILNLLDERYLDRVHDVTGYVDPIPTLVPYEEYEHSVLVYKMDVNHDMFMGLMQDFTDRIARHHDKELWAWFTQWQVKQPVAIQPVAIQPVAIQPSGSTPAFKKLRIDVPESAAPLAAELSTDKPPTPRPSVITAANLSLDSELLQAEEMLRVLIDIVQADPPFVPNYIEFMYQWIDYLEGDGRALKLALGQEIPSLWDFEYHPDILDVQKSGKNEISTDLFRKKPDLAALEKLAENSERRRYREVKHGVHLPEKEKEELLPLINVPKDWKKANRYYAACFKSRQKAIDLLVGTGVTGKQVNNYVKQQELHPALTSEEGDMKGLTNYFNEQKFAQFRFLQNTSIEKYKESLLSIRLASDAERAVNDAAAANTTTVANSRSIALPLIPPTPMYPPQMELPCTMHEQFDTIYEQFKAVYSDIRTVPRHMSRRFKSKAFEDAVPIDNWGVFYEGDYDELDEYFEEPELEDEDISEFSDSEDMDSEEDFMDAAVPGAMPVIPVVAGGPPPPPVTSPSDPLTPNEFAIMLHSMTVTQIMELLPSLSGPILQRVLAILMGPSPLPEVQALPGPSNAPTAAPPVPTGSLGPAQGMSSQLPASGNLVAGGVQGAGSAAPAHPAITVTAPAQIQQPQNGSVQPQPQFQALSNQNPGQGTGVFNGFQPTQQLPILASNANALLLNTGAQLGNPSVAGSSALPQTAPSPSTTPQSPFANAPLNPFQQGFNPPRPSIQRNVPPALNFGFGPLSNVSDTFNEPNRIPVQLYFQEIVRHADPYIGNTDAIMLGYLRLRNGPNRSREVAIELTKLIILPVSIYANCLRRVQLGQYEVFETYTCIPSLPSETGAQPYTSRRRTAYDKLVQAYSLMANHRDREEELTKRWRTSPGPMTETARGSIWEGWAVAVDRPIWMSPAERNEAVDLAILKKIKDREESEAARENEKRKRENDELVDGNQDEKMDGNKDEKMGEDKDEKMGEDEDEKMGEDEDEKMGEDEDEDETMADDDENDDKNKVENDANDET
ncbi:hypothetical protein K505DRAFT_380920 [Melanomma pulvis-pyrius CBS 109.77]|uniref:Uncharacterized protein n=1 Tax=Melanomma pulvis-pyrius CBS 109.77 TaxID=1314802 RepID=A0A6A6XX60_9PLEO|nr:hypothetical protein K505DRAFT_380920 [Melanomma pulvis-pyrius CBS 109.77]